MTTQSTTAAERSGLGMRPAAAMKMFGVRDLVNTRDGQRTAVRLRPGDVILSDGEPPMAVQWVAVMGATETARTVHVMLGDPSGKPAVSGSQYPTIGCVSSSTGKLEIKESHLPRCGSVNWVQ